LLEYTNDENWARDNAEEWANIVVLASTIKGGGDVSIPKSYNDAMRDPNVGSLPCRKKSTH
jgi:hypothetical protein